MDKNEFFRQATLRICGDLEIEEGMQTLLQFSYRNVFFIKSPQLISHLC